MMFNTSERFINMPSPPPEMTAAEIQAAIERIRRFEDPLLKAIEDAWAEFALSEARHLPRRLGDILAPICAAIVGLSADPDGLPVPLPQKREPERVIPAFPDFSYQALTHGEHGR